MTPGEGVRWCFRILVPSAMVVWGIYEPVRIWNAGWIWGGFASAIAFFVGLGGFLWLIEDARLLYKRVNENERR